jgi:hypothetical protein
MYTMVRKYVLTPKGGLTDLGDRVRDGFLPIVRSIPGFVSYTAFGGEKDGQDVLVTVSTFTTEEGARESATRAAEWVAQNHGDHQLSQPEITMGRVFATTTTPATTEAEAYTA